MANRKMLLVEGTDDAHVAMHICRSHHIPPRLDIRTHDGVEHLIESIPTSIDSAGEGGDAVGILVDADESAQNRWAAIRQRIMDAGYANVPEQPAAGGTIIDPPAGTILPRVGVWIMPDNRSPGILEDFLRFLAPAGSALFEHAEASVRNIPQGERRFRDVDTPKALIHTWLAWQETPGRPFGTAITARFLDPDVPQAAVFAAWLNGLFFAAAEMRAG